MIFDFEFDPNLFQIVVVVGGDQLPILTLEFEFEFVVVGGVVGDQLPPRAA